MKRIASIAVPLLAASVLALGTSRAQEARRREGGTEQPRGKEARPEERRSEGAHRPPPPAYQPHPPGTHPHGPMVRQHPTRVLPPRVVIRGGDRRWRHWEHPEFTRPYYYWDWSALQSVTCVAEDSYGDQYPVTEATGSGFGLDNMTTLEDDALDRCYADSGGDPSCFLLTCSPQ